MSTVNKHRYYLIGYFLVIVVAMFQRGSLALVNREANDNHYEVMRLLCVRIPAVLSRLFLCRYFCAFCTL